MTSIFLPTYHKSVNMCYNAPISIGTFVFAAAVAVWIFNRTPALAVSFVAIALMQLVEFFIWMDQGCGTLNKVATASILPTLALQPLLITLAVAYFRAGLLPRFIYIVLALCVGAKLVQSVVEAPKTYGTCTRPGKSGRLIWQDVPWKEPGATFNYYYPTMALLFATMKPIIITWPLLILYSLTYQMSATPSVWCNTVNACAAWALVAA